MLMGVPHHKNVKGSEISNIAKITHQGGTGGSKNAKSVSDEFPD